MTVPGVSCTAVAIQNSSEWPLFPVSLPPAQACGGEDILYIYFLIFPGHLEFWIPLQILFGAPLLAAPCYTISLKDTSKLYL